MTNTSAALRFKLTQSLKNAFVAVLTATPFEAEIPQHLYLDDSVNYRLFKMRMKKRPRKVRSQSTLEKLAGLVASRSHSEKARAHWAGCEEAVVAA